MKKYFFVAASAALVLSSCSNEIEQVTELGNKKQEIKVSTYTPGMTRADEAGVDNLKEEGFWLFAYSGADTIINSMYAYLDEEWVAAEESLGIQKIDTTYYWPDGAVNFLGVYPAYTEIKDTLDSYYISVNPYVNPADTDNPAYISSTEDVMISNNASQKSLVTTGQSVELKFNHVLAQVKINVKGANSAYKYKLYGLYIEAPQSSLIKLEDGTNTPDTKMVRYEFNKQNVSDGELFEDGLQEWTGTRTFNSPSQMICPSSNGKYKMYITYGISMEDPSTHEDTEVTALEIDREVEIEGIQVGKSNIINVTLTPDQLPILVTATATDWVTEETNPENVITKELN